MNAWHHGTNVYFENWALSETTSVYKRELVPHSFVSFSTDDDLLKCAGSGCCKIKINEGANIVNLLYNSYFSRELWKKSVVIHLVLCILHRVVSLSGINFV